MKAKLVITLAATSIIGLAVLITFISSWETSLRSGHVKAEPQTGPRLASSLASPEILVLPANIRWATGQDCLVAENSDTIWNVGDRVEKMYLIDFRYQIDPDRQ
jgi:hypothetical protein